VSSNPIHGEVYSIQHYVIKFVSDLRQVGGFQRFPPPIKLTKQPILVHFMLCFQYMSFCVFVAYHQVRLFSATSKQEVKNMLFIELMTGCYLLCSRTTCHEWYCMKTGINRIYSIFITLLNYRCLPNNCQYEQASSSCFFYQIKMASFTLDTYCLLICMYVRCIL
jgi:hypothetical protein